MLQRNLCLLLAVVAIFAPADAFGPPAQARSLIRPPVTTLVHVKMAESSQQSGDEAQDDAEAAAAPAAPAAPEAPAKFDLKAKAKEESKKGAGL